MSVVKFKGVPFPFGDKTLVIPPLNLRALEQMQDKIASFTGEVSVQQVGIVADVTLAALQRNYPDMTRDEVAEIVDLGNMMDVMNAVMGVSGLSEKGEAPGANQ